MNWSLCCDIFALFSSCLLPHAGLSWINIKQTTFQIFCFTTIDSIVLTCVVNRKYWWTRPFTSGVNHSGWTLLSRVASGAVAPRHVCYGLCIPYIYYCFFIYYCYILLKIYILSLSVSPVQKQPPGGGHRRGPEAGPPGSSAQHRFHRPGHRHHRSLHLSFRWMSKGTSNRV